MLKRRDLRGLSTVVATLLIILLVLVAIGIVWVVMKNIITNQSEIAEKQKEFFLEGIRIADIRVNNGLVNISLERVGGQANVKVTGLQNITREEVLPVDIISVVDISGSMTACNNITLGCCTNVLKGSYDSPNLNCFGLNSNKNISCTTTCHGIWADRIYYAKEANKELIKILSESGDNRVGLVAFNATISTFGSIDLTDNVTQLNNKIDSWQATSGTCTCCGINEAVRILKEQSSDSREKRIIVMSDGEADKTCPEQNTGDAMQDAIKASCNGKSSLKNLIIDSVGAGGDVHYYKDVLVGIANCGGGNYTSVVNLSDLINVYKTMVQEIKTSSISINRFSYLYIVFYNGTSAYREKISEMPDVVQIKEYEFNVRTNLAGNITKIEIYPVISYSGKEIIGPLFDKWELE